eukprot:2895746-Prymnesium_polylepis.1
MSSCPPSLPYTLKPASSQQWTLYYMHVHPRPTYVSSHGVRLDTAHQPLITVTARWSVTERVSH